MKIGIFKTSYKENEKRIPIYPDHIRKIPRDVREQLVFESGYGADYGYRDEEILALGCELAPRADLYACDIIILPKPVAADLKQMKSGGTLCGWTHAVQQRDIADLAIEKGLTLIAWEEMNVVNRHGKCHVFYRNNELAGYAGILHFLQLKGVDGLYTSSKKVVLFGYGSVTRGAIYALQGRGYSDITVYTQRPAHLVIDKLPSVRYKCLEGGAWMEDLMSADIIFNGVLQNVEAPLMFIKTPGELHSLKRNCAIIDISCDKGMGFYFAEPTSFEQPIIEVGDRVSYYSVDHTPTYLWNAASEEISSALLPYLQTIVDPDTWTDNPIIAAAIDIENGKVRNQKINAFQQRNIQY